MINHEVFSFSSSDEFVGLALAASARGGALQLLGRAQDDAAARQDHQRAVQWLRDAKRVDRGAAGLGAVCGEGRMVPRGDNTSDADAKNEWAADIKTHLARARLTWDF